MSSASGIPLRDMHSPETSRFLTEDARPRTPLQEVVDVFTHTKTAEEDEEMLSAIHSPWKRSLFSLLEQPNSSPASFLIHIAITALILTSALVTILETIPEFHSISTKVWFGLETMLVTLFTVEYIARSLAWSSTWRSWFKWTTSFYGVIDLLAIVPYYVEILLNQDTSVLFRFSILRMFRLLRVFRPFRYNNTILLTIEVMYLSVRRSQHALLAISFFVVMVLTVSSTLLYFAERGIWDETLETFINSDGDPTQFSSIPAAAWFVLVTITTVGYGEITPRSFLGRLVTIPLLVFGLLLIALPSFVLGREFSIVWERMTKDRHLGFATDDDDMDYQTPMRTLFSSSTNPHSYPPQSSPRSSVEPAKGSNAETKDLSNLKLAQNQTELRKQMLELRRTVETQGEMVKRLVDLLEHERKGKGRQIDDGL